MLLYLIIKLSTYLCFILSTKCILLNHCGSGKILFDNSTNGSECEMIEWERVWWYKNSHIIKVFFIIAKFKNKYIFSVWGIKDSQLFISFST